MPGVNEIVSAMIGAWRLLMRDPEALEQFESTIEAFWRSFAAFLLALPFYFLFSTVEWRLILETGSMEGIDFSWFVAVEMLGWLVNWIGFPVAMIYAARTFGLSAGYVPYITVFNWASLFIAIAITPPYLLFSLGLIEGGPLVLMVFVLVLIVVWYRWQIAMRALGATPTVAAGIVGLQLAIALSIEILADSIHRGSF